MADKRISQLPYVGNTGYTTNDIIELTLTNNDGSNFLITGFTDTYFTGLTFQTPAMDLTITRNDGFSDTVSLLPLLGDTFVTGGTYDLNTGDVEFTNSTGGTFTVTGFVTGYTDHYVTGGTYDITTGTLDLNTQTTTASIAGIDILHEVGTGINSTQRINVNSNSFGDCSSVLGGEGNTSYTIYSNVTGIITQSRPVVILVVVVETLLHQMVLVRLLPVEFLMYLRERLVP